MGADTDCVMNDSFNTVVVNIPSHDESEVVNLRQSHDDAILIFPLDSIMTSEMVLAHQFRCLDASRLNVPVAVFILFKGIQDEVFVIDVNPRIVVRMLALVAKAECFHLRKTTLVRVETKDADESVANVPRVVMDQLKVVQLVLCQEEAAAVILDVRRQDD